MLNPVALKTAASYLPVASGRVRQGHLRIPITGDEEQWIGRVDYAQSSKNNIFGRYFLDDFKNPPTLTARTC